MVKELDTIEEIDTRISNLKRLIDHMIIIENELYRLDLGMSIKGYIDSTEEDLRYWLLVKYKKEENITW